MDSERDRPDHDGKPRIGAGRVDEPVRAGSLTRSSRRASALFAVLLLAWCAASFALSAQSDPEDFVGVRIDLPDKVEHGIEYAVGGFLAAGVFGPLQRGRAWTLAVIFCTLWGISDEIHQSLVPGRDSSGTDLAADVAGAGVGALALLALRRRAQSAPRAVDESDHGDHA